MGYTSSSILFIFSISIFVHKILYSCMEYYLGLDIGSINVKLVID